MKKTTLKSILEIEFQYFLINLENDIFLNAHRKNLIDRFNEFIVEEEITECTEKLELCKQKLEENFFFNGNYQRQGEEINFKKRKSNIGHVVTKERLKNELLQIINEDINSINFLINISTLNSLIDISDPNLDDLKNIFGNYRIRFYQMWCFGNKNQNNTVMDGINPKDLPILLALDDVDIKKEKIFFEIEKPDKIKAYTPTFFDAGFSSNWKPGGFTNPSDKSEGLEEMIIDKLQFSHIVFLMTLKN